MKASPTPRLLIGFAVTLIAVSLYSLFTLRQVSSLRKLQADIVERNRLDSLQLLSIQDALNSLGLSLHDVLETPYGILGFEPQFHRLRMQLEASIRKEALLRPEPSQNANQDELSRLLAQLDSSTDATFAAAKAGDEQRAITLIKNTLRPLRDTLSSRIARMLVQNSQLDQDTEAQITRIYDRVERDLYTFLLATVLAIGVTGVALVYSNRRIFEQLGMLSDQKSVLARELITVQEQVLKSVSRELHDEFGQIFTGIGAMLSRVGRKEIPQDSPLRADLTEIREITQEALEKVRSLSQMLHPAVIDDYGLEKAIEWYLPQFQKQTGIEVDYQKEGTGPSIRDESAIHVYRILQEALNNVARHSGSKQAIVRVHYAMDFLRLQVEDRGKGLVTRLPQDRNGLGLVAMRERAELAHGKLSLESGPQTGTRVSLEVPITHDS